MAEQVKQEQGKEAPWAVKLEGAFLDGAAGAINRNGELDVTTSDAKRAKVQLAVVPSGIEVRYEAAKSVGGKTPTITPRRRVFPWHLVKSYDMPCEQASAVR